MYGGGDGAISAAVVKDSEGASGSGQWHGISVQESRTYAGAKSTQDRSLVHRSLNALVERHV